LFEENFDKLSMAEQENFRRIVNLLLAHTYLLQDRYDTEDHMRRSNPDYLFVDRKLELFEDYFQYSGFHLERDSNYGVISLSSTYDYNRQKFDKFTTLMLYVIRLIYEEQRESLSLSEIFITTGELIHKMLSLGVIRRKPAARDIRDALRKLSKFRIVERLEGSWEEADTKFIILPTVLFIITNERISSIFEDLETQDLDEEDNGIEEEPQFEEDMEPI